MSTTRSQDQTQHLHVLGTGKMPELQGGPSTALLESFPNRYPQRPYVISIAFPEFTSLGYCHFFHEGLGYAHGIDRICSLVGRQNDYILYSMFDG